MSILVGLVVATGLVCGWAAGSVLVAIFLTLGELLVLVFARPSADSSFYLIMGIVFLVIWAPFTIRNQPVRAKPAQAFPPGSLPLVINLKTPEERFGDAVSAVCTILAFAGFGWLYLHDLPETWRMITGRPFLTAIGFTVISTVVLRWGNRQPR